MSAAIIANVPSFLNANDYFAFSMNCGPIYVTHTCFVRLLNIDMFRETFLSILDWPPLKDAVNELERAQFWIGVREKDPVNELERAQFLIDVR